MAVAVLDVYLAEKIKHDHTGELDARYLSVSAIGSSVQAWDADLATIADLAKTDGNFIVGNGANWVVENGVTVRTSLGLVAGGDGDIWVEKAGDTMTGNLDIASVGGSGQVVLRIAATATSGTALNIASGTYTTQIFNISAIHAGAGTTAQALRFVATLTPTADVTNYYGLNSNTRLANSAYNIQSLRMFSTGLFLDPGAGGAITNLFHYVMGSVNNNGGTTTVQNSYGLYINALTSGTVSNYSIYTLGGLHHFGDNVEIQTLNVEAKLTFIRNDLTISASDVIGGMYFQSNDAGSGTVIPAYIQVVSTETHTSLKTGVSMDFYSTPSASLVTAKDLSLNGGVTIFTTLTITDAINIVLGTTTGTKLGTSATQKLGFFGATPVVQPTTAVTAATFVANTSGIINDTATFDGYTLGKVVAALRSVGVLA